MASFTTAACRAAARPATPATARARSAAPLRSTPSSRRVVKARAAPQPSPEQLAQMQKAYEEAMKDPEQAERIKQMEEAMKNPAMMQQMQQMAQQMQSGGMMEKMQALKDDPQFKDRFAEAEKKGMQGVMELMNDQEFMTALGKKLGPVGPGAAAAAQPMAPPAEPEIENLLDAAKYGDAEAVEDFISIGKDVNMADAESRTPLHYATAHSQPHIITALVEAGANLEATDSKDNTPLHYAAGYGRMEEAKLLLNLGASPAAKNSTGKTPLDLVKLNDQNPINADDDLLAKLVS
mmetsp:Transcript_41314/g.106978  ORF Transcript_41314/g.106978 Transcript_41314/m.106978 type:complete len:293 (+) Transcript_41314:91-969(+)